MEDSGCVMCDGPIMILGRLGDIIHCRCRNCGYDHSFSAEGFDDPTESALMENESCSR